MARRTVASALSEIDKRLDQDEFLTPEVRAQIKAKAREHVKEQRREKAEKAMNDARENAERAMTETREKAERAMAETREKAEAMANEAKQKAEAFANEAKEKAEAFANEAKEKAAEIWCVPLRFTACVGEWQAAAEASPPFCAQGGGGGERRAFRGADPGADQARHGCAARPSRAHVWRA